MASGSKPYTSVGGQLSRIHPRRPFKRKFAVDETFVRSAFQWVDNVKRTDDGGNQVRGGGGQGDHDGQDDDSASTDAAIVPVEAAISSRLN